MLNPFFTLRITRDISFFERYRYQDLPDGGTNYIRVATIEPGTHEEVKIALRIERFDDEFTPAYDAVSYAWGPPEYNSARVLVYHQEHDHGETTSCRGWLGVRSNLLSALRQFRHENESRDVWIDALCINQNDNGQKGPQVAMMGDIFRKASRVLVWLGPEENDSNHAMDFVQRLGVQIDVLDWHEEVITASEHALEADVTNRHKPLRLTERDLGALNHLFFREWFDRLWIRQEIYLARPEHAVVCVGGATVSWSIFRKGWYLLDTKVISFRVEPLWRRLALFCSFVRHNLDTSLPFLRTEFKYADCEDPRDRIYAVLSLLEPSVRAAITPDYSKSTEAVYEEAAIAHITSHHILDVLNGCNSSTWQGPSWVPDWSCNKFVEQPLKVDMASGMSFAFTNTSLPGRLQVTGVFISTITKTLDIRSKLVVGDEITRNSTIQAIRAVLKEEKRPLHSSYSKSETILEAYSRVMCPGVSGIQDPPDLSFPREDVAKQFFQLVAGALPESMSHESCVEGMMKRLPDLHNVELEIHRVYTGIYSTVWNRALIHTTDGSIGVAPSSVENGDQVWSLLGCPMIMLLRENSKSSHLVVGPSYVHGFSTGESILGPFPDAIRPVYRVNSGAWVFENIQTGLQSRHDPRLPRLGIDLGFYRKWIDKGKSPNWLVKPDALRPLVQRWGYDLHKVNLV
ncbi:heterokaryon incompatibility protein-domain-containing protein [Xylariaceae sp. FL1019]|nr:heterokaryon incompatibility protein-domain-containing protein [Xylariaceae sp. FL1019]